ncbi:MAG TPA: lipid-binding SYLF domain-containing protein [Acetobacteraceae bacterium]|nr:lipid-binding SYLF domain-containing protein [Acetobacteraceae bacterium]
MRRIMLALAVLLLAAPSLARAQGEPQIVVDRATLTVQEMMSNRQSEDPRGLLRRARAVLICPRVFKAGFFFGGSGGDCVLLGRAGNGTWSYPAFYAIGSGSFGFQFGIEDSSIVMMIMTNRGLNAVLDSHFKIGAGAGLAIATIGAGVQGSTTAAVGADIVAFAQSRGLYGGISLEGSILSSRSGWDQAYYRQPLGSRQIVMQMQGANPGADPLRAVLTRYGSVPPMNRPPAYSYQQQRPAYSYGQPPSGYAQQGQGYGAGQAPTGPGYAPAYPPMQQATPGNYAPVQQQNLPPPPNR